MTFFHLGLTGYPLDHSLSPRLQAAALQAAGLAGEYCLYPVLPLPEGEAGLQALASRLRQGELHGLNVTVPHKSAILSRLDELTPLARAVGAVNTVYLVADRLFGDNTDVGGFRADLERFLAGAGRALPRPGIQPQRALVLGAGGSARAVVYTLALAGFQVWVAARRSEQALALVREIELGLSAEAMAKADLPSPGTEPGAWLTSIRAISLSSTALRQISADIALLVNTTPLGMYPHTGASAWPEEVPLPASACVYDLVYNPPETALLSLARRAGLPACGGLGMLVEQAALAFERWTDRPASRAAMQAALAGLGLLEGE